MFISFIAAALAYPTVIWTVVLSFMMLYWLLVAGGALDAEALGTADSAAEAAGAAAGEAFAHGAADHAGISDAAGLLSRLGLRKVPLTVTATAIALINFAGCHLALRFTGPVGTGMGVAVLLAVFVVSVPLGGVLVRPLRPLFHVHSAPSRQALVGKVGEVCTGRVDEGFGQARVEDGGAGLIIEIRASGKAALKRGDRALLLSWDPVREAFEAERYDDLLEKPGAPGRGSPGSETA